MDIKAIQTKYNGYHFRSRIEARWAVFFDALGVIYQYEPEGYKLRNGSWYLPDFLIPDGQKFPSGFYEVKPDVIMEKKWLADLEFLHEDSQEDVFLLIGPPDFRSYLTYRNFSQEFSEHQWYNVAFRYQQTDLHFFDFDEGLTRSGKNKTLPPGNFSKNYIRAVRRARSARF